ncbi:MAG: hypothetical protein PHS54_02960 [Clostridia bacterium]|nr:hypothetical protein [Clostridia bacterium]
MITKETFEKKKEELTKILEKEKTTLDEIQMNIMTIQTAINFCEQQLASFPKEEPQKKKGLFSKK